jgi:hypothetical protein
MEPFQLEPAAVTMLNQSDVTETTTAVAKKCECKTIEGLSVVTIKTAFG